MFADAPVAALTKGEETENRHLHVDLVHLRGRRYRMKRSRLCRQASKTGIRVVLRRYSPGASDRFAFADVLNKCIFDLASNTQPAKLDNEFLGLKMAAEDELEELLRDASKSTRYEANAKVWLSMKPER
jgi:hypothetical protein